MIYQGGSGVVSGVPHTHRVEDILFQELSIALTRNFLDEVSQEHIAGIAISHLAARLELERLIAEARHELLGRSCRSFQRGVLREAGVVRDPGRMREQIEDRDLVPCRRRIAEVLLDRRLDLELAALLQKQDAGCRKLLGDGA